MPTPRRLPVPDDPVRASLVEVRRGLLRLHKAMVDSERAVWEREHGALSNGQFLQLLLNGDAFEWMRPYSGLVAEMDEELATRQPVEPARRAELTDQVLALIAPSPDGEGRYDRARERDPAVLMAHVELSRRVAAALKPTTGAPPMAERDPRAPRDEPAARPQDEPNKQHGDALQDGSGSRQGGDAGSRDRRD